MSWLRRLLTAHDVSVDADSNAVRTHDDALGAPAAPTVHRASLTTAGAGWVHTAAFEAGKYRAADIRLTGGDGYLVFRPDDTDPVTAPAPAGFGCLYPVNARLPLPIDPTATRLHLYWDGVGNATAHYTLIPY